MTTINHTTTAIYENGAFKPIKPIKGIPEHTKVRISIETFAAQSKKKQLEMLLKVPYAPELADAIEEGRKKPWIPEEF